MKQLILFALIWLGLSATAQQAPAGKSAENTKEARVKQQQAEQEIQKGRAEKKQIQEMVRVILQLKEIPKPDDAADALAAAITHSMTVR